MSTKEKARSSAATLKRAEGTAAYGRAAVPDIHSTTAAEGRQIKISDYLAHGAESAIPRRHLRQLTGLSDRDLRRQIELERREGSAICSDNLTGYFGRRLCAASQKRI